MLTGWTVVNKAFAIHTILSDLIGWPLLVAPGPTKIEPTGTLRNLEGPSSSSAWRNFYCAVRWSVPETSEILGDVPYRPLICLVCRIAKWGMIVGMIARSLCRRDRYLSSKAT